MSKLDANRKLPHVLRRYERKGSLFRAEYVDLEFSNGERRTYTRVLRQGPGGVIIVAMPDDEHALLIREYAGGQHRYELGLPKGRLEPGEHSTEGANRELQEECGYAARSLQDLGYLTLIPGLMEHRSRIVLARDLYESWLPGDEPEEIDVIKWPLDDLVTLIQREDFSEGRSIAALYMVRDLLAAGKLG